MTIKGLLDDLIPDRSTLMEKGLCVTCREPAMEKCATEAGRREVGISGMCEVCWDKLMSDDIGPDDQAVVLPVNAQEYCLDHRPNLEEMQKLVGGYIERVRIEYEGVQADMIVNEDGIAMRLPRNPEATKLYQIARWPHVNNIYGPAVILTGKWRLK